MLRVRGMTSAHLISDIHLEFADLVLPGGAEILVVAGDMAEARSFFRNDDGQARKQAAALKRFVNEEFAKYPDVIYIAGNHEAYGRSIAESRQLLKNILPANVHFLENDFVDLGDVTIWGATLWTDINADNPATHATLREGMNDFHIIDEFSTYRAYVLHHESVVRLKHFLSTCADDRVAVVTHHAPSNLSVNAKYLDAFHMNGGYRSSLEEIMHSYPCVKTWCHGHMHDPSDYKISDTRVLCHPRGYAGYEATAVNYQPFALEI